MSKGGGGGGNQSQVYMQQQEAAEARQKEAERKARLEQGMKVINRLFDGAPIMGTRKANLDLSKFNPDAVGKMDYSTMQMSPGDTGLAKGFKYQTRDMTAAEKKAYLKTAKGIDPNTGLPVVKGGGVPAVAPVTGVSQNAQQGITGGQQYGPNGQIINTAGSVETYPGNATVGGQPASVQPAGKTAKGFQKYEILDAKGKVIGSADSLDALKSGKWSYDEKYDTGKKTSPFQAMMDKYEALQKSYYMPELDKQFGKANEDLTYAHINAGTSLSSMAAQNAAELVGQKKTQTGAINSQIQDSLGQLKRSILSDKQGLINQLYATENPTMASNEALAKVRTINSSAPALSPIGDLFKTATVGAGAFLQAANDPYNNVNYGGYAKGNSRTIPN